MLNQLRTHATLNLKANTVRLILLKGLSAFSLIRTLDLEQNAQRTISAQHFDMTQLTFEGSGSLTFRFVALYSLVSTSWHDPPWLCWDLLL